MPRPDRSGTLGGRGDGRPTAALLTPFDRDVLLATGRVVRVRPSNPGDVDQLRVFYQELSDDSSHFRFFGVRRTIPLAELERSTIHDVHHQVTLVIESSGRIIGVGEYHVLANGEEAEVAFAVADAHHHEGVATVLLEDLALIGRAAGLRRLVAETLTDNAPMLRVFASVGLVHRTWFADGVVNVQLDLTSDHLLEDDADLRDWRSAVESLRSLVQPAHVVVIGAGRDESSPGGRILAHLRDSFTGTVSVVDPAAVEDGVGSVTSLAELGLVPDLAVVAVPAAAVADVVADCGRTGVPTAVVVSAGFAELGTVGASLQDDVLAIARRHGMRIVGPNSLGVVSTACGLNATITSQEFSAGGIAIASQSGGVGVAIAVESRRRHAGISSFVSMGNKADVSGNDLLRLWAEDDQTNVILLYLESFGDPVRFGRVARAVSLRKPIVALKSGGWTPGRRGARPGTVAVASDQVVDALFAHTGVIRARTLEELVDVGLLLDRQAAPAGRRVALVGNEGGPLLLGADAADVGCLDIPQLSPRLRADVARIVPSAASTANPIDLGSSATPHQVAAVVRAVSRSGEADACIVVCVDTGERGALDDLAPMLAAVRLDGFPVALSQIGAGDRSPAGTVPTFPTPERAATAVALAAPLTSWRASIERDARTTGSTLDAASFVDAGRLARAHAAESSEVSWLGAADSVELLETAGLPVVTWRYVRSADECVRAVRELGSPCVVKADVSDLVHDSDAGAVRSGISDAMASTRAYADLEHRFGDRLRGVVVQTQHPGGMELLVGVIRDPAFGPFVVVGAGGVETELRDDRVMLVAPVSLADARRAVEGLRMAPLFHGFRGRPTIAVEPVADLVHRVGVMAASIPEIHQLDMNPVRVDADGCLILDAVIGVAAPQVLVAPARAMRGSSQASRRGRGSDGRDQP